MNGIRILDMTRVLAGPWAVQHLADQGADVVKVEPPGGDETRGFGPFVDGHSTYFLCANRDKRSIVLDLRTSAGRDVLGRLIAASDVLVENFRPGVAERLGFGWESLHAANPRLIYVAIHAFGTVAGWADRPGYDLVLQAMGGAAAATGFAGSPPVKNATSIADLMAGLWASQAVLLGLLERERTGRTQKIVVNMMQVQASALAYHATRALVTGQIEEQRGNAHRGLVPYDTFRCADGWIALACGNDAIWKRMVDGLSLAARPGWSTNAARVADRQAVDAIVAAALAPMSVDAADRLLASLGVPAGPVLTMDKTLDHAAVERVALAHAALGPIEAVGPGIRTVSTRANHDAPPLLGADRDSVLREVGYTPAEIDDLQARGAFG